MSSCISDLDIPKKPPHKSASEHRRATKPIMEKRRRARINNSLNELKSLILDALNKDPSRHSKLEKADILEMTVRHLQNLQRQQMAMEMARDPSVLNKFRAGFTECASEVSRYVNKIDGVDGRTKQRLISHLHGCVTSISSIAVTASQAAMQNVYPAMMATGGGGRDGQQHQLQLHIPGMAGGVEGSLFPLLGHHNGGRRHQPDHCHRHEQQPSSQTVPRVEAVHATALRVVAVQLPVPAKCRPQPRLKADHPSDPWQGAQHHSHLGPIWARAHFGLIGLPFLWPALAVGPLPALPKGTS
ncbi:Transcription factor HES-1 [Halotydeus destructor]|nr:Transcription factor HES-1 [Halotydeus destructor]